MSTDMRPRSPRQDSSDLPPAKRQRRSGSFTGVAQEPTSYFAANLFENAPHLREQYESSQPFKHVVIDKLFQESLLMQVKDEVMQLSFTEKETDIYKVMQTGDLQSLNYLDEDQRKLFPALQTLRDSLYSKQFRDFIHEVTGCGPLSSRRDRQDMSVNSYKKTCHLLNHDDVIGSRKVSYILYMPLPIDQPWQTEWGGALELYPVVPGSNPPEPAPNPSKTIPPSWGQWVMFEVQPGKSFHSVEEVVVDTDKSGRQRLSISGWFHRCQPGEEGYEEVQDEADTFSSLKQLISHSTLTHSYNDGVEHTILPTNTLTPDQISFLSKYINPVYLSQKALSALTDRFASESSLELYRFLVDGLAEKLRTGLAQRDEEDGLGIRRARQMPYHSSGTDSQWHAKGPPHKARYCVLSNKRRSGRPDSPSYIAEDSPEWIMRQLQEVLFPSPAFRTWLAIVTSLLPLRHTVEARRFRPGLDYTLATSEETESRLDVCLGLTPPIERGIDGTVDGSWQTGEWGGWECYLPPADGDEDPTVYRSSKSKRRVQENGNQNGKTTESSTTNGHDRSAVEDEENEDMSDEEEEDDSGPLLTVQPGFNRLLLVLRDERVMHFVKYLSASAPGCRWDVCGEWEVGMVEESDQASASE
ncbi:Prolyl 3,4-dihydroxylase ofd1; AltName: Full=2-oxoglutarate and Fe(II) dioxygenase domain-containing protein 1; AltName: Full=PKHD-type hydroxylase ofd1 [Serendipita indica DSM 11827]|nr:Prolyl 3,4-dihydroxylase ofd1; AltName: Full=2-oxoglutarate and Fe(II) dioxygenase domain-containing protein 1; AltName: Full=PKHD-type hydroxylase ofd1 [Serendipita indica DSM 11827]